MNGVHKLRKNPVTRKNGHAPPASAQDSNKSAKSGVTPSNPSSTVPPETSEDSNAPLPRELDRCVLGSLFFSGTCLSTCCFGDLVLVLRNVKHGGRSPGRNEVRCSSVHCHVFATFGAVNQALVRELERPRGDASWQAAWEPRSSWRIVQIVGDLHVVPVQRKYWTRGWASAVQAPTGTFRIA